IETTGLADPAPVLQAIMADRNLEQIYRLDGVVTLIDAVNGIKTLGNHLEALKQAAVADRLVLTKTDVASSEDMDTLTTKLKQLNPTANLLEAAYGDVSPERLLDVGIFDPRRKSPDVERWINEEAFAHHHGDHGHDHHHHHEVNRHDDHISAFCIRHEEPIPSAAAGFFLDVLMAERGSDLLRIKGILNIAEMPSKPMVIHGVQHVIHTPAYLDAWPSDDHDSRLVFIVKDITKESIENLLKVLLENRPYHEISDALPKKPAGNIETL
ncbi:MAG: GTP-binding protein, partial [Pseudomonadota bacterium]